MESRLTPATITRSVRVIATKGKKTQVSYAFTANFQDGSTKVWCNRYWIDNRLLQDDHAHGSEHYCSPDTCPLYYRDWSHIQGAAFGEANRPTKVLA
jgi:hypothetical protein